MTTKRTSRGIFAGLVQAVDWYDNSLQNILAAKGMQVVNRTQAMILVHINSGITRPSAIAREMRLTRQNIHTMAKGLIDAQLITLDPDPKDGRSGVYALSASSASQRKAAVNILAFLDKKLADRIGKTAFRSLHKAMAADWGEEILDMPTSQSGENV
jgi:DNA-binding MarR family transcriptional regulator